MRNARDAFSCLLKNERYYKSFPFENSDFFFSVKAWKTHSGNRNLAHEVALSF